jgi:hypothetical protein
MNININLDKFKPLFKASVDKLDFGVGFSLYVDTKGLINHKLQASKDLYKGHVFYNSVVKIITNPRSYIKGINYMCPSNSEYISSLSDYIKGTQLTIMLEKKGMWLFRPSTNLISLIHHFMPDVSSKMKELEEGNPGYSFEVNDQVQSILHTISHNSTNYGLYLGHTKNLIKIEHPEVEQHYMKLTLEDYIQCMYNVLNDPEMPIGYEVQYLSWDDSLNFNIYINDISKTILKNMEKRGTNIWSHEDTDLFIKTAKKSKDLVIIRK